LFSYWTTRKREDSGTLIQLISSLTILTARSRQLVDRALSQVSNDVSPIVIRLSGDIQRNDRLAIREIAWQLSHQTGKQITVGDEEDSDNPDINEDEMEQQGTASLPPPAYLPSLISTLPSQPKPVVVILDAFDEFALHGRQALLYCLLDTVQSCRVGSGLNGLAIIGVTNRVDTINLLEKRVKSRFSGRMLRTAGPRNVKDWWKLTGAILTVPLGKVDDVDGWKELWGGSVNRFLEERSVKTALHETWALVKDVRMLTRILVSPLNPRLCALSKRWD
jgi:origin recognition complex subunit 4